MLLEQKVIVKWNGKNKKRYVDKGYLFTKMGDSFLVSIRDLNPHDKAIVKVQCDYCLKDIEKSYVSYLDGRKIVSKDCCNDQICKKQKSIESNLIIYGVEWASKTEETKNRQKEVLLKRSKFQKEAIKQKSKETCLERYGVPNAMQSPAIKEKLQQTCIERFGVKSPPESDWFWVKVAQTNLGRYGVENPFANKGIQEKIRTTLYKNGSVMVSQQQEYIHKLIGGELNYPIGKFSADIYLEPNIILEYHGGGHNLEVKHGGITQEQFDEREKRRNYYLRRRDFKIIEIFSRKDWIPSDLTILEMIQYGVDYLDSSHSWIQFDIDDSSVRTSQFYCFYDYGKLRKITKKDIA